MTTKYNKNNEDDSYRSPLISKFPTSGSVLGRDKNEPKRNYFCILLSWFSISHLKQLIMF